MKPKYTPAPWYVNPKASLAVMSPARNEMCVANCGSYSLSTEDVFDELAANARLIAAAPDLLEALILCRTWLDATYRALKNNYVDGDYEPLREAAEKAGDAIAKAKGEQI